MGLDWEQGSDWLWRSGCLLALLGPTAEKRKKGTPEGIRLQWKDYEFGFETY